MRNSFLPILAAANFLFCFFSDHFKASQTGNHYINNLNIKLSMAEDNFYRSKSVTDRTSTHSLSSISISENSFYRKIALYQTFNPHMPLGFALQHLANAQSFGNKASYPRSVYADGTIKRVTASDWTSGFFPGSLWYMYEYTKDTVWRTRAEVWNAAIESQKFYTSTHDIGFMLFCSYGAGYRLTGSEKYKSILLQGAKSLASRFNSKIGCIKSWDDKPQFTFPVIIDNLMNLELLFWATKVTGDSSYYKIAVSHALTTIKNHIRPDGSSYHVVDYNPLSGSIISKVTYQGLNNLSDWARGQAWGLYGFTLCYRETGDTRFLTMAQKIADFLMMHENLPEDLVPYWDYDAFDFRDASAASIASAAFLELYQYVAAKQTGYYNFGINILRSISSNTYFALPNTNNNFLLKHCVGNKPKNSEVDKPLIYADYYFIEALLRCLKPAPFIKAVGGNNQIDLSWNKSTGAQHYRIQRSSAKEGPYSTIVYNLSKTTYKNTGLASGKTYYYKVIPYNIIGQGESSKEVKATTNIAPSVSITQPINGTEYTSPAIIHLKAIAKDLDGYIKKVQFFNESILLKTEYYDPYTYTWQNVQPGTYQIIAKATDDKNLAMLSEPILLIVSAENKLIKSASTIDKKSGAENGMTGFKLTPNPVKNLLTIELSNLPFIKPISISIIDATGVAVKSVWLNGLNKNIKLDVSAIKNGVYFVNLNCEGKVMHQKFVKL